MTEAELNERLERLERDNRRLKRLGRAALFVVAAGCAIYAASCSFARTGGGAQTVSQKITAHELDIVDASGRVLVRIASSCTKPNYCWPSIDLYEGKGGASTSVGAGVLTVSGQKGETTLLDNAVTVTSKVKGHQGAIAELAVGLLNPGGSLSLSGEGGMSVMLQSDENLPGKEGATLVLHGAGGSSNFIFADANGPTLEIADAKGYFMQLGSTQTMTQQTGQTQNTSAASIVMFGNDKKHHVIWQVP